MMPNTELTLSLAVLGLVRFLGALVFVELLWRKRDTRYLVLTLGWLIAALGSFWGLYTTLVWGEMENTLFSLIAGLGTFLITCGALMYFNLVSVRLTLIGSLLILGLGIVPLLGGPGWTSPGVLIQLLIALLVTYAALFQRRFLRAFARSSYFWLVVAALLSILLTSAFALGFFSGDRMALGFVGTTTVQLVMIIFFLHLEYNLSTRELLESERRYQTLFEEAPIALCEQDVQDVLALFERLKIKSAEDLRGRLEADPGLARRALAAIRVIDVNQQALRLLEAPTPGDFLQLVDSFFLPEALPAFRGALEALAEGKPGFRAETSILTRSGRRRHIILSIHTFLGPQYSRVLVSMEDITSQKEAAEVLLAHSENLEALITERTRALQAAQDDLLRQERLAVLGQFAGSVGHELRNPLAVISNAVYYLKMTLPKDGSKTLDYIGLIEGEAQIAARIVTDLLDHARLKPGNREWSSLVELLETALHQDPAPEQVRVERQIPPGLPPVYVDPRQMQLVLSNVLRNAYQAMSPADNPLASEFCRGELTIEAGEHPGRLVLTISDSGVGVPDEQKAMLFRPLYTTKPSGIGLGLVTCQTLMDFNDGSIELLSAGSGKGATLRLELPTTRPETSTQ